MGGLEDRSDLRHGGDRGDLDQVPFRLLGRLTRLQAMVDELNRGTM